MSEGLYVSQERGEIAEIREWTLDLLYSATDRLKLLPSRDNKVADEYGFIVPESEFRRGLEEYLSGVAKIVRYGKAESVDLDWGEDKKGLRFEDSGLYADFSYGQTAKGGRRVTINCPVASPEGFPGVRVHLTENIVSRDGDWNLSVLVLEKVDHTTGNPRPIGDVYVLPPADRKRVI